MLALPAPSRRLPDVPITIRCTPGVPSIAAAIAQEVQGFGCPPATAERLRTVLLASGRYDACVNGLASSHRAIAFIGLAGGELLIRADWNPA